MKHEKTHINFDSKAVRNWTLYVLRLDKDNYYVGITSRKDFMQRIRQHGGRTGAKVNFRRTVNEIVEIQPLGKMTGLQAQKIENDMMLEYRKRYGAKRVRGGYEVYRQTSIIPTYTPGSTAAILLILACLIIALGILAFLVKQ